MCSIPFRAVSSWCPSLRCGPQLVRRLRRRLPAGEPGEPSRDAERIWRRRSCCSCSTTSSTSSARRRRCRTSGAASAAAGADDQSYAAPPFGRAHYEVPPLGCQTSGDALRGRAQRTRRADLRDFTDDERQAVAEICAGSTGCRSRSSSPRRGRGAPAAGAAATGSTSGCGCLPAARGTWRSANGPSGDDRLELRPALATRRPCSRDSPSSSAAAASTPPRPFATRKVARLTSRRAGSLVEKSLLRQRTDADGEPRFWMLETIREYALERLEASGEVPREAAARRVVPGSGRAGRRRLADGRPGCDLRPARSRAHEHPRSDRLGTRDRRSGPLLRIATALWEFWATRGHIAEGRSVSRRRCAEPRSAGSIPARAVHPALDERAQRGPTRGCPGRTRGVRGARRRFQPRAGVEPARPRRGELPWRLVVPSTPGSARSSSVSAGTSGRRRPSASADPDQRDFRAAPGRGGNRPLPYLQRGGRRSGYACVLLCRAGAARSHARRVRSGA